MIWKNSLYFLKKAFLIFRKWNFLERYISGKVYLEPQHIQNTVKRLWWIVLQKSSYLVHSLTQARKNKKIYPEKKFPIFWEILALILKNHYISGNRNPKKLLIFSQKEAVLILQEMETPKKFLIFFQKKAFLIYLETETPPQKKILIFQETQLSYISGNRNPKKISYISQSNFQSSKNEKAHS